MSWAYAHRLRCGEADLSHHVACTVLSSRAQFLGVGGSREPQIVYRGSSAFAGAAKSPLRLFRFTKVAVTQLSSSGSRGSVASVRLQRRQFETELVASLLEPFVVLLGQCDSDVLEHRFT